MGIQLAPLKFNTGVYKLDDKDAEKIRLFFYKKELLEIISLHDEEYVNEYTKVNSLFNKQYQELLKKFDISSNKSTYIDFEKKLLVVE